MAGNQEAMSKVDETRKDLRIFFKDSTMEANRKTNSIYIKNKKGKKAGIV